MLAARLCYRLTQVTGGGMGKMHEGRAEPPDFGGALEAPQPVPAEDGASRYVAITSRREGHLDLFS